MKWGKVGEVLEYFWKLGGYLANTPIPKTSHTAIFQSRGNIGDSARLANIISDIPGILGVDRGGVRCYPISGGAGGLDRLERPITPSKYI
jgi:hypothetical protein